MKPVNRKSSDLDSNSNTKASTNTSKTFTSFTTKGPTTMNILHRSKAAAFAVAVVLFALYVFAVAPTEFQDGKVNHESLSPDINTLASQTYSATNVSAARTGSSNGPALTRVSGKSPAAGQLTQVTVTNAKVKITDPGSSTPSSPSWGVSVGGIEVPFSSITWKRVSDNSYSATFPGTAITANGTVDIWQLSGAQDFTNWAMSLAVDAQPATSTPSPTSTKTPPPTSSTPTTTSPTTSISSAPPTSPSTPTTPPPSSTCPPAVSSIQKFDSLKATLQPTVWVVASPGGDKRTSSDLYRQVSGTTSFEKVSTSNWVYNALAFSSDYTSLFAVSQGRGAQIGTSPQQVYTDDPCYPAGHLLQINSITGQIFDLGRINDANLPQNKLIQGTDQNASWPNDLFGGINSGFIDSSGNYWFANTSASGTKRYYKISLATHAGTSGASNPSTSEDMSIVPSNTNYAWGIKTGTTTLERLDLRSGAITPYDLSTYQTPAGVSLTAGTYGKAWTYGNGNLGIGRSQAGGAYQIQITNPENPTFALVAFSDAPGAYNIDGASYIGAPTDLNVVKKLVADSSTGRAQWEIVVTNTGKTASSGFVVSDSVPSSYKNVKLDSVLSDGSPATYTESKDSTSMKFQWTVGPLAAGKSTVLRLSADRVANAECSTNTASILPNEADPNTSNNTSTDNPCQTSLSKDVVDANNDGVVDAKDGAMPGPNGTQKITFTLSVKNNDTKNARAYSLKDSPGFASVVNVQGAKLLVAGASTEEKSFTGAGPYEIVAPTKQIAAGATHVYTLEVYYTFKQQVDETKDPALCQDGTAGKGLYNSAELTDGSTTTKDDACVPITNPKEVQLQILKVDADGKTTPPAGAKFEIHSVNADGNMGPLVKTVDDLTDGYYGATLEPNKDYYLLEVKSPKGYNLMPAAVKFNVAFDANSKPVAKIYDTKTLVTPIAATQDNTIVLQVADVLNSGTLPKTGGSGIWVIALIGAALIGAGAWWARRNSRK